DISALRPCIQIEVRQLAGRFYPVVAMRNRAAAWLAGRDDAAPDERQLYASMPRPSPQSRMAQNVIIHDIPVRGGAGLAPGGVLHRARDRVDDGHCSTSWASDSYRPRLRQGIHRARIAI